MVRSRCVDVVQVDDPFYAQGERCCILGPHPYLKGQRTLTAWIIHHPRAHSAFYRLPAWCQVGLVADPETSPRPAGETVSPCNHPETKKKQGDATKEEKLYGEGQTRQAHSRQATSPQPTKNTFPDKAGQSKKNPPSQRPPQ